MFDHAEEVVRAIEDDPMDPGARYRALSNLVEATARLGLVERTEATIAFVHSWFAPTRVRALTWIADGLIRAGRREWAAELLDCAYAVTEAAEDDFAPDYEEGMIENVITVVGSRESIAVVRGRLTQPVPVPAEQGPPAEQADPPVATVHTGGHARRRRPLAPFLRAHAGRGADRYR